jgi:hypothetical protein
MAGKEDAKITVGADASAADRVFAALKAGARDTGTALRESIGSAARAVASDLAGVALEQGKVNFSSQMGQVREFEASSARMAVAMRRDQETLRSSIEETGVAIGKRPQEVATWSNEVGQLTYNLKGATEEIKGLSGLAAETGRSVDQYRGLAVVLGTVGHVAGDSTHAIGVMYAQAEQLGTAGGVAAFADQIEGLGDTISRFAIRSEADFLKVTALAGELGKGLSPQAASRVQQGALGALASDPTRWERFLGHSITDEHGQIADPTTALREIVEKTKKRYGKDASRVLRLNFGAETGAALYGADLSEAGTAAGAAPSSAPADAQRRYLATDAGKRDVAGAELAESSRALMGSSTALGRAADALQQFAAHNPLTSTLLTGTIQGALGKLLAGGGGGAGAGGKSFFGGGALGTLGAAGAMVTGVTEAYSQIKGTADEIYGNRDGFASFADDLQFKAFGKSAVSGQRGDKFYQEQQAQAARNLALAKQRNRSPYAPGMGGPDVDEFGVPAALAAGGPSPAPVASPQNEFLSGITRAVVDGMKGAKFTIVNGTGGPVEVANQAGNSASAGHQG